MHTIDINSLHFNIFIRILNNISMLNNKTDYFKLAQEYHKRKEFKTAFSLLHRASVHTQPNSNHACAWIGLYHELGYGTRKDPYTAMLWYRFTIKICSNFSESWVGEHYESLKQQKPVPLPLNTKIYDPYIGNIELIESISNTSSRYKFLDKSIKATYDPNNPYDMAIRTIWTLLLDRYFERIHDNLPEIIDESFTRNYEHFKLTIQRNKTEQYRSEIEEQYHTLLIPASANCKEQVVRETIIRHIKKLMRTHAEQYLTIRLSEISKSTGLKYNLLKISNSHHTLGCYYKSSHNIDLSWHLIKYPQIYIDAVIIHELCHSLEFNHDNHHNDLIRKHGGEDILNADINLYAIHQNISRSI